MKRVFVLVFALVLVAAACGDDDATSTSVTQPNALAPVDVASSATTAPADNGDTDATANDSPDIGAGESTDFCQFVKAFDEDDDSFEDLDPESVRADMEESQKLIKQAQAMAPSEIKAEVRILADAFNSFVDLLAANDYNLFALASDEPALLAFDNPEVEQAGETVDAFCGIEDDFEDSTAFGAGPEGPLPGDDTIPVDATFPPGFVSSDLPENFPNDMVPPSVIETATVPLPVGFGVIFTTSASFEDTVAYYVGVVGEPTLVLDEGGQNATWILTVGTSITTITVAESDGMLQVAVSSSG